MTMMSKRKGKTGEREAAHEISRVFGVEARRGVQYTGGPDSPDVVGLPGCHMEVKRVESLRLYPAMEQAKADAGANVPVVLHRRNRGEWLAIVRLQDMPRLSATIANLTRSPAGEGTDTTSTTVGTPGGSCGVCVHWKPMPGAPMGYCQRDPAIMTATGKDVSCPSWRAQSQELTKTAMPMDGGKD